MSSQIRIAERMNILNGSVKTSEESAATQQDVDKQLE
jgi:hypothetical protein